MRPFQDGDYRPGARAYPCPCGYHPSDAWILVDTLLTIVASAVTILVLVLRHPFTVLTTLTVVWLVGAVTGWW